MRRALAVLVGILAVAGILFALRPDEAPRAKHRCEVVVLLHGLGRTSRSMGSMARYITQAGYSVLNVDHPSTELPFGRLVEHLEKELAACCPPSAGRIHFVTHSSRARSCTFLETGWGRTLTKRIRSRIASHWQLYRGRLVLTDLVSQCSIPHLARARARRQRIRARLAPPLSPLPDGPQ